MYFTTTSVDDQDERFYVLNLIREYLKETTKMRDRPGEKEEEEEFEGAKERKRFAF